jgi:LysR family transcriptional regulator, glycine cleavage system transcriptional activator
LTVTTLPSFAACWLTPRIGRFIELEPDVEINLISTCALLDFTRDGVDAAIRWTEKPDDTLDAALLMKDEMLVVASPEYLRMHSLKTPSDLAGCALLRAEDESWIPWFMHAGLDWQESSKGLFFNDSSLALRWAENGRGVVLTRRSLADESLRNGTLIQPFDITVPDERIYWFVTPADVEPTPLLQRFRQWVFSEAQAGNASERSR